MKKQTAQQQVKEFCRQQNLTVDSKNGVPTISMQFAGDKWFIECFNTWDEALKFLQNERNAIVFHGKSPCYSRPNIGCK